MPPKNAEVKKKTKVAAKKRASFHKPDEKEDSQQGATQEVEDDEEQDWDRDSEDDKEDKEFLEDEQDDADVVVLSDTESESDLSDSGDENEIVEELHDLPIMPTPSSRPGGRASMARASGGGRASVLTIEKRASTMGGGRASTLNPGLDRTLLSIGMAASSEARHQEEMLIAEEALNVLVRRPLKVQRHLLDEEELEEVGKILQRRQWREKDAGEDSGSDSGNLWEPQTSSSWAESWEMDDSEIEKDDEMDEDAEIEVLIKFLRCNALLRKAPEDDLQWLASRLKAEKVPQGPVTLSAPVGKIGQVSTGVREPTQASLPMDRQLSASPSLHLEVPASGQSEPHPFARHVSPRDKPLLSPASSRAGSKESTCSATRSRETGGHGASKWSQAREVLAQVTLQPDGADDPAEAAGSQDVEGLAPSPSIRQESKRVSILAAAKRRVTLKLQTGKSLAAAVQEERSIRSARSEDSLPALRFMVHGTAKWKDSQGVGSVDAGDMLVDITRLLPASLSWPTESKNPHAKTALLLASVPLDSEVMDRFGSYLQPIADRAGTLCVISKEPARRTNSETAVVVQCLRQQEVFGSLPLEALDAVLALEGRDPLELLIPLTSAVTAWRRVPLGTTLKAERYLSRAAVAGATAAIEAAFTTSQAIEEEGAVPPLLPSSPTARNRRMSVDYTVVASQQSSLARPSLACVQIVMKDHMVQHSEWPLAGNQSNSVSLVAHRRGKALSLSKSDYDRHVRPHRPGNAAVEVAMAMAQTLPRSCRSAQDVWWLQDTPISSVVPIRLLPPPILGRMLRRGRLRRLRPKEELCNEGDRISACFLVLSGAIVAEEREGNEEPKLLKPGAVFGEWVASQGSSKDCWGLQYSAADEGSLLYEIPKSAFKAAVAQEAAKARQSPPMPPASEIEQLLRSPVGKRSFQELQSLSMLLARHTEYKRLDTYARLDIAQCVCHRKLPAGEAAGSVLNISALILSGEVDITAQKAGAEVRVLKLFPGDFFGEEVGTPDGCILRAKTDASLLWLDRGQVSQAPASQGKKAGTGDKISAASAERHTAIQALKFKAPNERTDAEVDLLTRLVKSNKFYAEQEDSVREEACRAMSYIEFQPQEPIIRQGDIADMCYILLKGSACIWVSTAKQEPKEDEASKEKARKTLTPNEKSLSKTLKAATKKSITSAVLTALPMKQSSQQGSEKPAEVAKDEKEEDDFEIDPATGGPVDAIMVKVLEEGACFGEAGLLHATVRNASIIAKEPCQLGAISKGVFERVLRAAFQEREQKRADFIRQHLPKPPSGADHSQAIGGFFAEAQANRGHMLCHAGKPCDRLFLIREGHCKVFVHRAGKASQEIASLGVGQMVGISTLMLGLPAEPYSVMCASPEVKFLRMDGMDVRSRIPVELRETLAASEKQRLERLQSRVSFLEAAFGQKQDETVKALIANASKLEDQGSQQWLESPFLANKSKASLLEDGTGRVTLMQRYYSDKSCNHHAPVLDDAEDPEEPALIPPVLGRLMRDNSPDVRSKSAKNRSASPQQAAPEAPEKTEAQRRREVEEAALEPMRRRQRLHRLLEKQSREAEDIQLVPHFLHWSPNLAAEHKKMQEQINSEAKIQEKQFRQAVKDEMMFQHTQHLKMTRPDLADAPDGRRYSAEIRGGFYLPTSAFPTSRARPTSPRQSDPFTNFPVWLPSTPPNEILKPVLRERPATPRSPRNSRPTTPRGAPSTPTSTLRRVMAAPVTAPTRVKETGLLPGEDAAGEHVLQCRPMTPTTMLTPPTTPRVATPRKSSSRRRYFDSAGDFIRAVSDSTQADPPEASTSLVARRSVPSRSASSCPEVDPPEAPEADGSFVGMQQLLADTQAVLAEAIPTRRLVEDTYLPHQISKELGSDVDNATDEPLEMASKELSIQRKFTRLMSSPPRTPRSGNSFTPIMQESPIFAGPRAAQTPMQVQRLVPAFSGMEESTGVKTLESADALAVLTAAVARTDVSLKPRDLPGSLSSKVRGQARSAPDQRQPQAPKAGRSAGRNRTAETCRPVFPVTTQRDVKTYGVDKRVSVVVNRFARPSAGRSLHKLYGRSPAPESLLAKRRSEEEEWHAQQELMRQAAQEDPRYK
eukprot:TRINITY_DN14972_c0_g1_i2.p1 TRINITY_DN14972_c0_g1~~TRINITY_DN14972_c0_g1_i2.p1  ORF type:complete len:2100 (+),score=444.50 TRINITY_DN14972_c0_g1_i2:109-6408(+)